MRYHVDVGADGLLIRHQLGSRFVPWAEVVSVEPYARGVVVKLSSSAIALPLSVRRSLLSRDHHEAQIALVDRAHVALDAYRDDVDVSTASRVARRGRSRKAWFRSLFERRAVYRGALPPEEDELWRIVESPGAEPTARAGAAAVLAQSAGDAERGRLRIAADACAAPALRVVLERAASGAPEDDLHEALAAIEDEESGAERRMIAGP